MYKIIVLNIGIILSPDGWYGLLKTLSPVLIDLHGNTERHGLVWVDQLIMTVCYIPQATFESKSQWVVI